MTRDDSDSASDELDPFAPEADEAAQSTFETAVDVAYGGMNLLDILSFFSWL